MRHDGLQAEQAVDIGAADMDAPVRENVRGAIRAVFSLGRNAHNRKVGRAAANVGDERILLLADGLLIGERGGDRLILESDVTEPLRPGDLLERVVRPSVCRRIVVHEMHRPAEHDLRHVDAERRVGRTF